MNLLTFLLDGDRFGIDAAAVHLVERAVAITPLPRAPDVVEGVIDVHGALAPVYDLRRRFGRRPRPVTPAEHLIIASSAGGLVAFRVDEALSLDDVSGVLELPQLGAESPRGGGVARLGDGTVAIYDLDSFLSASERSELDAALDGLNVPTSAAHASPAASE